MYQAYKKDVEFFLVYVREAHPSDGGGKGGNFGGGPSVKQPKTDEQRRGVASDCVKNLKLSMPTLIDGMDNKVGMAYAGFPDRIYVVAKDGKILYKAERGPQGFKPDEAEAAIKKLLGK